MAARPSLQGCLDMAVLPVSPDQVAVVWEQVLLKVRDHLASPQAFETWFRPIIARELSPQEVDLEVPNAFFVDWIHEHYLTLLRAALADTLGHCPVVHFSPREPLPLPREPVSRMPAATVPRPAPPPGRAPAPTPREWLESQLHPRLTFESFVVGASNR